LISITIRTISLAAWVAAGLADSNDKISKETFMYEGKKRSYYLYVPGSVNPANKAPLILMLHGSGRNGLTLVEKWKDLAKSEGIILAGPDSLDPISWSTPGDGPGMLYDLVEFLKTKHPINPQRVYLFGHSAGAVFSLAMAMYESAYFTAAGVHAGAWRDPSEFGLLDYAKRKIPMAIVVGDRDAFFPVKDVRATETAMKSREIPVEVTVLTGHTHNYYGNASKVNGIIWEFLKTRQLEGEPRYQDYEFKRQ
jgi:poly(3-hydroxybutyrate) depolymerase